MAWAVTGVVAGVISVGFVVGGVLEGEARLAGEDSLRPRLSCGESI